MSREQPGIEPWSSGTVVRHAVSTVNSYAGNTSTYITSMTTLFTWKVNASPWSSTGEVDARIHIYTATAPGRGTVSGPTLGRLYPGTRFIGAWVTPRANLDTKKWEKFPSLRHPRWNPTVQSIAKRLAAWATWPILFFNRLIKILKSDRKMS